MVTIDEPEIVRNGLARVLEELGRDHPRGQESGVRGQGLRVVIPGLLSTCEPKRLAAAETAYLR
jgi:hypothetical protein